MLEEEGIKAICEALEQNKTLKELDISGAKYKSNIGGSAGAKHVAKMLGVNGGLTSLDLSVNQLCGVGTDYRGQHGTYTAEGITAIADAMRVNGALTSVNLSGNQLGDKGWGAIFAAICGNKDSKIMSLDASYEKIGPAGGKLIAEALRTSVTGALTKLSLAQNQLEEEGTKAICEALEQNTTLKELDISGNGYGNSNIGGTA
jgi:NLR family CARD domain-containing protein 3